MMCWEWKNNNIAWHCSDVKYNKMTNFLTKWKNIEENDTDKND